MNFIKRNLCFNSSRFSWNILRRIIWFGIGYLVHTCRDPKKAFSVFSYDRAGFLHCAIVPWSSKDAVENFKEAVAANTKEIVMHRFYIAEAFLAEIICSDNSQRSNFNFSDPIIENFRPKSRSVITNNVDRWLNHQFFVCWWSFFRCSKLTWTVWLQTSLKDQYLL